MATDDKPERSPVRVLHNVDNHLRMAETLLTSLYEPHGRPSMTCAAIGAWRVRYATRTALAMLRDVYADLDEAGASHG